MAETIIEIYRMIGKSVKLKKLSDLKKIAKKLNKPILHDKEGIIPLFFPFQKKVVSEAYLCIDGNISYNFFVINKKK